MSLPARELKPNKKKRLSREAQYAREEVYKHYVAMYLRLLGWGIIYLDRGPLHTPDPGDLLIERNGREEVMEVKEAGEWTRPTDRHQPWFPYQYIGINSRDNLHQDRVYCIVATDLHAMAFVRPNQVPEEEWNIIMCDDKDGPYEFMRAPLDYAKRVSMHLSGRRVK